MFVAPGFVCIPGNRSSSGFRARTVPQFPSPGGTNVAGYGPGLLFANGVAHPENVDFAFKTFVNTAAAAIPPQTPRDFDGDGRTDIAVFRPQSGTWFVLKSSTNFSTQATYAWGAPGDIAVPGDYDGDGKLDLAVFRPSSGVWFILKSSTDFSTSTAYQWGNVGDIPMPGDYDGDGKIDLAVFRPSNGFWFILKSSTNFSTYVAYQWGIDTDMPPR